MFRNYLEIRQVLASPNLKECQYLFMRCHENSSYAWVDVFFGPNKAAIHVTDKSILEIVKTLRPSPGKTAAHV
jgi:hypothetical protein